MSRYRRKTDANQQPTIDALHKIGCSVVDMSRVGHGCPDLLVGFRGFTILMEVKNADGFNRLTPKQKEWISLWKGDPVHIVRSPEQAVEIANSYGK